MKTIIAYQCEICNKKYDTSFEALSCEDTGLPDTSKYPIGLMYEYHHNGYVGIFCIAKVEDESLNKHCISISSWAFRTPPYPSCTIEKDMCGGSDSFIRSDQYSFNQFIEYHNISKEKVGCDEFNKMVLYLRSKSISPIYYTKEDKKLVSL